MKTNRAEMSPIFSICCSFTVLLISARFSSGQDEIETVLVQTTNGPILGEVLPLHNGRSVHTFLGVPYAKPPIGDLRWRPPEDPTRWDEPFIADTLGAACPQKEVGLLWITQPFWNRFNESCLHMNIFAPADKTQAPFATMVWLHGGAYEASANIQYPGYFLASRDVVVVVPNYRLGILGFASTGDDASPGNYGLLDQLHALRWVRANIEAFGGDPNKVTIFGQSAGGSSVGLMLMSPMATGLFHQAILHSGSDMSIWAVNGPEQHPENYTKTIASQMGCPTEDNYQMMDCLRSKDASELMDSQFNCTLGFVCLGFAPVVDGAFLPDMPLNLRRAETFNIVPEMIGITREDGFIYLGAFVPTTIRNGITRAQFERYLRIAVRYFSNIFPDATREDDVFEALNWHYSPWPHLDDEDLNRHEMANLVTDVGYGMSMDTQIKLHTPYATTYQYVFAYISSNASAVLPTWMGCPHMLDLPYVFGMPLIQLNPNVRNQSEFFDIIKWNELDIEYADYTMDLWTNFAKFGRPTLEPIQGPTNDTAATWDPFTNERMHYFYIGNDHIELRENYRQQEYAFWEAYLNKMVVGNDWPFPLPQDMEDFHQDFSTLMSSTSEFNAGSINDLITSFVEEHADSWMEESESDF